MRKLTLIGLILTYGLTSFAGTLINKKTGDTYSVSARHISEIPGSEVWVNNVGNEFLKVNGRNYGYLNKDHIVVEIKSNHEAIGETYKTLYEICSDTKANLIAGTTLSAQATAATTGALIFTLPVGIAYDVAALPIKLVKNIFSKAQAKKDLKLMSKLLGDEAAVEYAPDRRFLRILGFIHDSETVRKVKLGDRYTPRDVWESQGYGRPSAACLRVNNLELD